MKNWDVRHGIYIGLAVITILIVLFSDASAACESDGTIAIWWTLNSTLDDCTTPFYNATAGSTNYTAAVYDDGDDLDGGTLNPVIIEPDGAYETAGNRTIAIWARPNATGVFECIAGKRNIDNTANFLIFQRNTDAIWCMYGLGAAMNWTISTTNIVSGNWYHIVCMYDVTNGNTTIWINGTMENQNNEIANQVDGGDLRIGCYPVAAGCDPGPFYASGQYDEFVYLNRTLNSTEIGWLMNNNSVLPPVAPAANCGCGYVLNSPADNYHTNDSTPEFNFTPTCYGGMPSRFYLTMNGTQSGDNSTVCTNGSSCVITANSSKADGYYRWNISNPVAGGCTNTSSTRGLYIDTVAPQTFIYVPNATSVYYYGDSHNFTVAANDTHMFNLTVDLNHTNGTIMNTWINDTGSAPWFNLTAEFTSGLDVRSWWLNASSMDSHTGKAWNPDSVSISTNSLLVVDKGKSLQFITPSKPVVDTLKDRIKWGFQAPAISGLLNVVVPVESDCPIYIIEESEYAGHFVTTCGMGDGFWSDFQDLEEQGFSVDLHRTGEKTLEVRVTGNVVGKSVFLDPATGGLNFNSSQFLFNISADSALYVNHSVLYQNTLGYFLLYYRNITTGDFIQNASCYVNVTDPYSITSQHNASEMASYYLANYTPVFTGNYSYVAYCWNASGWWPANVSANFTVSAAPPSTGIDVSISNKDMQYTNASCIDNYTSRKEYEKRVCIGSTCENIYIYEDELCEMGCYGHGVCRVSWLRGAGPWPGFLIVLLLGAGIIYFAVFRRKWL